MPTLVQQGCDVIVAVDDAQATAVRALTGQYPGVRFFSVETMADADDLADRVASLLPAP